jgi:predicted alpha/beta-hydrolase family hydrolase
MSIVDDLIENLVERHAVKVNGALTIRLVDGGLSVGGRLFSTVRDQRKGKDLVNVEIPVDAQVRVRDVVIPLTPAP